MQQIVIYFWRICLLQAGPEQVPNSRFVLGFTFAVYFVVALLTMSVGRNNVGFVEALGSVVIGVSIQAALVWGILAFKGVTYRFPPTMSALLGTNALILIATLPLGFLLVDLDRGTMRTVIETLFLVTFFWWLAIAGFVLHRSSNISMLQGIVIVFGMEMIVLATTYSVFPPAN